VPAVEAVVVFVPIAVVIVRRWLILGHPGAAALAIATAVAPLARTGVVILLLVVVQIDTEAKAEHILCLGLFASCLDQARTNSKVHGWTSLKEARSAALWPGNSSASSGAW
jgi:hypothetical protein